MLKGPIGIIPAIPDKEKMRNMSPDSWIMILDFL